MKVFLLLFLFTTSSYSDSISVILFGQKCADQIQSYYNKNTTEIRTDICEKFNIGKIHSWNDIRCEPTEQQWKQYFSELIINCVRIETLIQSR